MNSVNLENPWEMEMQSDNSLISQIENSLGKGEVVSSILTGSITCH
jgi:hypothetical protein